MAKQRKDTGGDSGNGQTAQRHWRGQREWPNSAKALAGTAGMAKQRKDTGGDSGNGQTAQRHWRGQREWPNSAKALHWRWPSRHGAWRLMPEGAGLPWGEVFALCSVRCVRRLPVDAKVKHRRLGPDFSATRTLYNCLILPYQFGPDRGWGVGWGAAARFTAAAVLLELITSCRSCWS